MGGGVGLSAHASHRVVTERSSVAMPEVGIGFFPDVGVSFMLARAPGAIGTHLHADRRSHQRGGRDLLRPRRHSRCRRRGIADIPAALAGCHTAEAVRGAARCNGHHTGARPPACGAILDRSLLWRGGHRADIVERLRGCDEESARAALRRTRKGVADLAQGDIAKRPRGASIRARRAELPAGLPHRAGVHRRT